MSNEPLNPAVLLVVDMQDGFLRAIPDGDEVLNRCCFAVEAAKLFDLRTVFTVQAPDKLGGLTERLDNLAADSNIFEKTAFSALESEELWDDFEKNEVEHIILAGIETTICVYQTVLSALQNDIDITLLSDCISGRRVEDRGPTFNTLALSGCHILPSEALFYAILEDAKNPLFRDFTQLVKKYNPAPPRPQ